MKSIIMLLALLAIAACGPEELEQSGGAFYEDMGVAQCDQAAECGLISFSEVPECVDRFVNSACAADLGVCQRNFTVPAEEWDQCLEEFETHACESIADGILPSECLSIEELV